MISKVILVVDDDPDVRLGLQVRLGVNDYTTIFATSGTAAITAASTYSPDLILLDLGLPATDGYAVLDWLREQPHPIPAIIISGRNVVPDRERALEAGAKAYLQKPVDNAHLLTTIRRVLEASA
jgi:two-component system KDP operon response regulator KdpE